MPEPPQISVVIPVLGQHEVLARVLDGYEHQDASPGSFEVLVVSDPAEPDPGGVATMLEHRSYPVRQLHGGAPGASANRNAGWEAAAGPIVLFTDSDTIPTRRLLSEHLSWHRRHPADEVVVLGRVRWAPGIRVTAFMRWLEEGVQFDYDGITGAEASWAHVYTANCSIKRAFIELVGGFDARRLPYGYEDLDWGYRAREHGLRVLYDHDAVVDHWREMTLEQWRSRAPRLAVSEWRFCQKHPDVPPWFQRQFAQAAALPPGGRRSAALTRIVPRRTPLIGRLIWERATLYWRQQIGEPFLSAWNAAAVGSAPALQPAVSAARERASSSGGS